jgi:hypothetical protein
MAQDLYPYIWATHPPASGRHPRSSPNKPADEKVWDCKTLTIPLLWDGDVVEPGELFFVRGSPVAAAHPLKLIKICAIANGRNAKQGKVE